MRGTRLSMQTILDNTWMDLTVIEPSLDSCWLVSNPISGKCFNVNGQTLIELLLDDAHDRSQEAAELERLLRVTGIVPAESVAWTEDHEHWWKRGWHPSLEYYLWSRQVDYIDIGKNPRSRRSKKLIEYERQAAVPKPFQWKGSDLHLPEPLVLLGDESGGDVITNRRTVRKFRKQELGAEIASSVLWYAFNSIRENRLSAAKAGKLGLLQSFGVAYHVGIAVFDVTDISEGIYGYDIAAHKLIRISSGSYRERVSRILMRQPAPNSANVTVFLIADYPVYFWRYRHARALRNLYIEAGRIAQSIIVAAEAFGLKAFPTPAIKDGLAASLLNIDESRLNAIHSVSIGLE
ncbi:SagB/ThcOx family dehydrogenase [Aeromonas encheleia]|uniref:SagB/ThcOx family dehydrogenase n=1 Tax=Aeromonas encheleia TaxID=73010 RepID=UPI001F563C23|nr:SagB/ThcOx family dehydrogenase [Aeromonas encheleia]UNP89049.1 SagB/ThcOx family dehydrogenase [Aeromonas encheleia]